MKHRILLFAALPALVFVTVLAGCNGGESESTAPANEPAGNEESTAGSGTKIEGSGTKQGATAPPEPEGSSANPAESEGDNEASSESPETDSSEKSTSDPEASAEDSAVEPTASPAAAPSKDEGLARAYFASGCFWCVEAIYESVRGVKEAYSGFSGGHTENPTYESTLSGDTGHVEAVEVIYDPEVIDYATLVDVYLGSQDVTQEGGQGPDNGPMYESVAFYRTDREKKILEKKLAELNEELGDEEPAIEVKKFEKFWQAEDYHQNYEERNPADPYVRNVSIPRVHRFKEKFPELLKEAARP